MDKKVLVLGGTGAMGRYLVPELLKMGFCVDSVSLDDIVSDNHKLTYVKGNAKDIPFLEEILKNKYQLIYARMFQRITDNTKILEVAEMKQSELMPLAKGLKFEFENSKVLDWERYKDYFQNVNMDNYLSKR